MATEYASEFPEYIIAEPMTGPMGIDIIEDYSASPVFLSFVPDPDMNLAWVTTITVFIEGNGPVRLDTYGTIPGLTNGVKWSLQGPEGTVWQSTPEGAKRNMDWRLASQDWDVLEGQGQHKGVMFTLTMEKYSRFPLPVEPGNFIQLEFNDDFSDLIAHRFIVRGGYATP